MVLAACDRNTNTIKGSGKVILFPRLVRVPSFEHIRAAGELKNSCDSRKIAKSGSKNQR